jgi:hypothetical protein
MHGILMPTSLAPSPRKIAIIGAGMAGLTAAIRLQAAGHHVVIFEKSRGPGGRLASRRTADGSDSVDIGAQYFTIRNEAFRTFLDRYAGESIYASWNGPLSHQRDDLSWEPFKSGERYVGVPRMTAISRALSAHARVEFETRIERLSLQTEQSLLLTDTEGVDHGPFDDLILTAPPAQAQTLLATLDDGTYATDPVFTDRPLAACWTLAMGFPASLGLKEDGFSCKHPILQWVANNSRKPGRKDNSNGRPEWWVLHARADWSEAYQSADKVWVEEQMLAAFQDLTGATGVPDEQFAHRWLYAKPQASETGPGYRWYAGLRIGLCGDWLVSGRVEGAFESAEALVACLADVLSE